MTAAARPPTGPRASTTAPATALRPTAAVATTADSGVPAGPPVARPPARKTPTPKVVRGWLTFTVVALVLFAALGVGSLVSASSTLRDAGESIGQLSRIEQIRTDVLRADASAAHLFLGAETTDYPEALAQAREILIVASTDFPADQAALRDVNRELDSYAERLAEARIARGTPAGEAALTEAGSHLRTVVLPALNTLVEANSERVADQTTGLSSVPLALSGVLALAGLIGTAIVLGVRFRRVVNLGITAALILTAAAFAYAQSTLMDAGSQIDRVARNEIATFQASAAARGLAYNARAQEGLALIQRSSDPAADEPWSTAAHDTAAALARIPGPVAADLTAAWDAYVRAHEDVRAASVAGQWDDARRRAVGSDADSAGGRFAVFDAAVTGAMTDAAADSRARMEDPRARLTTAAVGVGLGGLTAILCTLAGVRPRLQEYA